MGLYITSTYRIFGIVQFKELVMAKKRNNTLKVSGKLRQAVVRATKKAKLISTK